MWFYKFELNKQNKITKIFWNTKITYFKNILGFGGVLACFMNQIVIAVISLVSLVVMLGIYLYKYGDLVKALRVSEKANELTYTGSRYSFKQPLIIKVSGI